MLLLSLVLFAQLPEKGLVFENSSNAHFSNIADGVLLRQGPGWLRLPDVMLDYELTFEYRLSASNADAGVVVRSWAKPRGWPEGGYRVRLPAAGADASKGLVEGRRAKVEIVRAPSPSATATADGWRRIHIKVVRQRVSITLDESDAGEYQIESVGGRVMFDARKGDVELRKISVKDLEQIVRTTLGPTAVAMPGTGVTMPVVAYEEKPQYTREAMIRRVEGTVEVEAIVLPDGRVGETRVVKSLDPDLDRAGLAAVRLWRFLPGTKDGRPVPVRVVIELTFVLGKK